MFFFVLFLNCSGQFIPWSSVVDESSKIEMGVNSKYIERQECFYSAFFFKILFLLHVDKLYSSQTLLNCHMSYRGEKLQAQAGRWLMKDVCAFHWIFSCESQCAHLLSPWPKALRKFRHPRYAVCSTKGRLWVCRWDLSVSVDLGWAAVLQVSSAHWSYIFDVSSICLLGVWGFAPWPWVALHQWNHPVEKNDLDCQ